MEFYKKFYKTTTLLLLALFMAVLSFQIDKLYDNYSCALKNAVVNPEIIINSFYQSKNCFPHLEKPQHLTNSKPGSYYPSSKTVYPQIPLKQ